MTAVAFISMAAVGALARVAVGRRLNHGFPTGTVLVNVSGSFALGLLAGGSPTALVVVGTGGLGAYTTFSGLARDAIVLLTDDRRPVAAFAYVVSTVVVGVAAAAAGITVASGW